MNIGVSDLPNGRLLVSIDEFNHYMDFDEAYELCTLITAKLMCLPISDVIRQVEEAQKRMLAKEAAGL